MKYIGFDIGGTKCAVCVGEETDYGVEIIDKEIIPQDLSVSAYGIIDKMCELAENMTDDFSRVGISCGGPLNSQKGIIQSPPNLTGWDNIEIVKHIKNRWNSNVHLQNDANACAVAEWRYGAGRGCDNMIFLTFGTGLGAGLILDGRLYTGTNDMAGEIGHIRLSEYGPVGYGKAGSFEGFCSGNGIAQLGKLKACEALQMGESVSYCRNMEYLNTITAKSIAQCADNGFEDAKEIYRLCGQKLGYGLAMLIDVLNPQRIVIGSVFQRSETLLRESMESVLEKECLPYSKSVCKVVPAELGENIGDIAAIAVAAMD